MSVRSSQTFMFAYKADNFPVEFTKKEVQALHSLVRSAAAWGISPAIKRVLHKLECSGALRDEVKK